MTTHATLSLTYSGFRLPVASGLTLQDSEHLLREPGRARAGVGAATELVVNRNLARCLAEQDRLDRYQRQGVAVRVSPTSGGFRSWLGDESAPVAGRWRATVLPPAAPRGPGQQDRPVRVAWRTAGGTVLRDRAVVERELAAAPQAPLLARFAPPDLAEVLEACHAADRDRRRALQLSYHDLPQPTGPALRAALGGGPPVGLLVNGDAGSMSADGIDAVLRAAALSATPVRVTALVTRPDDEAADRVVRCVTVDPHLDVRLDHPLEEALRHRATGGSRSWCTIARLLRHEARQAAIDDGPPSAAVARQVDLLLDTDRRP